ncbi:MAG TPA: metallophosphoesterase, partial [Prosthecobacter sp.]|nr:metallophosphoesterase [Prosthecobacter sp.]
RHRFYHVLGNHDFDVARTLKPQVPGKVGLQKRYDAFELGGFRFVFLDTTDVSIYAHEEGTPEHAAGEAELQRVQAAALPQAKPWNSGLSGLQLQWLDTQCTEAAAKGVRVIAFAHHPVAPAGGHDLWNSEAVLQLVSRHRHLAAWINGHNHAGAYAEMEGAHFVTVHGMVETAETNAFATAELMADRLIIAGHGREPSRELVFRV